ncbi:MAG: phosphate ABC transporter permease subunit PstC [Pseudomonadota bacterium]|nr:phosphate ABC transporter permease subunit PstC [Pseudomonadota bacterium]
MEAVEPAEIPREMGGGGRRRLRERLIEGALAFAAASSIFVLLGIFGVLLLNGGQAFLEGGGVSIGNLTAEERAFLSADELAELTRHTQGTPAVGSDFLFSSDWNPTSSSKAAYGVLGMVVSTIMVTMVAIAIAAPVGVGVAAWLAFVAPPRAREILKPILELLAAIPSVVVGFIGIVFVGPLIARVFHLGNGLNALNGALLLSVMALPTIISISEDAVRAVPKDYVQASLALGADRWQTLVRVVLPAAASGILAAVMLGMGRAIGETMTVLMATGNAIALPHGLFDSVRTLTATIAIELGEVPHGSRHYDMLFAVGLVLFLMTFAVNLVSDVVMRRGTQGSS